MSLFTELAATMATIFGQDLELTIKRLPFFIILAFFYWSCLLLSHFGGFLTFWKNQEIQDGGSNKAAVRKS